MVFSGRSFAWEQSPVYTAGAFYCNLKPYLHILVSYNFVVSSLHNQELQSWIYQLVLGVVGLCDPVRHTTHVGGGRPVKTWSHWNRSSMLARHRVCCV